MAVAIFAAGILSGPNGALAADVDLVTKAPALVTPAMPATCTGVSQFFLTDCVLSWYGISVYGTVDTGGGYQTHGAPFNGSYPQGASYSIQKMNRQPMWGARAQRPWRVEHRHQGGREYRWRLEGHLPAGSRI